MTNKELFLDTAIKIGNRLVNNAIWENDKCTWKVMSPDRENPQLKKAKEEIAGSAIYQGTSGIAVFLIELFKITRNANIIKTAEGAIKFAIEDGLKMPDNSFGFHSGRVGIAYATTLFASTSEKNEYLKIAEELLTPLKGNENKDYGWDVIGGAAGAIPILLIINDFLDSTIAIDIAENLGENLIDKSNMEPIGWSWGGGNTNFRNLCGLAHGAAGVGHAFLELYNKTGKSKYLYACEQAFLYERQFYNNETKNWPDFRYSDLSEYIYNNQIEELKKAVKNGTLKPYETKYMSAWCHGSPGIGLTRIRMYEITKSEFYKNELINAVEGTLNSCSNKLGNYSLCHGIGGNTETLIYASSVLGNQDYLELAEKFGLEGIEKFESKNIPWPCGTMGSVSDPSLMLGEAGIGYFYLRLYDQNIPSVVLPISPKINKHSGIDDSYKNLQKKYISTYFNNTLIALESKKNNQCNFERNFKIGEKISDLEYAYNNLKIIFENDTSDKDEIIKNNFDKDRIKYEMTSELKDFSEEYIDELKRIPFAENNLQESNIKLMPFVKVIETNLIDKNNADEEITIYTLLFRKNNKIFERELTPFSYLILKSIEVPISLNNLVFNLSELIEIEDSNQLATLRKSIIQQLEEFYRAQIISVTENNTPKMKSELLENEIRN